MLTLVKIATRTALLLLVFGIVFNLFRNRYDIAVFCLILANSLTMGLIEIHTLERKAKREKQYNPDFFPVPVVGQNDVEHLMEHYDNGYCDGVHAFLEELVADEMLYDREQKARELIEMANDFLKMSDKVGKFSFFHPNGVVFERH